MAQTLADEDEYEEEDLLDDQQVATHCPECGDEIHLTEEVFLISFARAYSTPSHVELRELNPAGLPVGRPWFYCFDCWEATKEELQEECEDVLPIEDVHDQGLLECDICHSDICEGETFALETFGEIHWSKRSPSGVPAMALEAMGEAKHICIDCISNTEDNNQFQLEVHDYDNQETCAVGRHLRCWRDRSRCIHCPKNNE